MKVRSPAPSPKHQQLEQLQIEATSSSSSSSVVIPQVVYATDNSVSPRLSLLRRPYSTPRVPRDGYAFLLILVSSFPCYSMVHRS